MRVERDFKNPTVVKAIETFTEQELAQLLGISQVSETLSENEKLRLEALKYYKNAPSYPLDYANNKMTREEMNER